MRAQPGTIDVDSNYVVGKPELGVEIDREKAADLACAFRICLDLNVRSEASTPQLLRRR